MPQDSLISCNYAVLVWHAGLSECNTKKIINYPKWNCQSLTFFVPMTNKINWTRGTGQINILDINQLAKQMKISLIFNIKISLIKLIHHKIVGNWSANWVREACKLSGRAQKMHNYFLIGFQSTLLLIMIEYFWISSYEDFKVL